MYYKLHYETIILRFQLFRIKCGSFFKLICLIIYFTQKNASYLQNGLHFYRVYKFIKKYGGLGFAKFPVLKQIKKATIVYIRYFWKQCGRTRNYFLILQIKLSDTHYNDEPIKNQIFSNYFFLKKRIIS